MSASKPKSPSPAQEDALDEALEETFPASDPISIDPSPTPPVKPRHEDDGKKGHDTHHRHGKH